MSSMRNKGPEGIHKPPPSKRLISFGFIDPNGSASYAVFPVESTAVQVAEKISREAGGQNWPLKIEGTPVEEFDFKKAEDKIHDITWATTKDVSYYKSRLEKTIQEKSAASTPALKSAGSQRQESSEGPYVAQDDALVAEFTESRAAAIEAEFGQLIISCLDNMEETIDALIAKKIELLREKARIEATIIVLEERIDGFKTKADGIIELVDPFEKDIAKLGGTSHDSLLVSRLP